MFIIGIWFGFNSLEARLSKYGFEVTWYCSVFIGMKRGV